MSIKNEYQQHNFLSNTGFGTVSPTEKVDVVGNTNVTGSYKVNGTDVLTGNTLGSGVTSSSLTSVGTLSSLNVSGNLTVDTNTLFVDSTNNRVGIGSATPVSKLDIIGSTEALYVDSKNTTGSYIRLHNNGLDSNVGAAIHRFGSGFTSLNTAYGANILNFANWGADMSFLIDTAQNFRFHNDTSEIVRITGSGNVGIGTTLPNDKLDIYGSARITSAGNTSNSLQFLQSTPPTGNAELGYVDFRGFTPNSTNRRGAVIVSTTGETWTNTSTPGILRFYTTPVGSIVDIERMTITSAGNVGIGTDNTSSRLEIFKNDSRHVLRLSRNDDISTLTETSIEFHVNDTNHTIAQISSTYGSSSGSGAGAMRFYTKNTDTILSEKMIIDHLGNVGIGTQNPDTKLQVRGILRVQNDNVNTPTIQLSSANHTNFWTISGNVSDVFNGEFFIRNGSDVRMKITSSGGVEIPGNVTAGYSSAVTGGVYLTQTTTYGFPAVQAVTSGFSGNENLLINPVGGKVGIGTDNPQTKLHVNGAIIATSNTYTPASGGTVSLDLAAFSNHIITHGGANLTLANPTNQIVGSSGQVIINTNGTSRTISFGTNWKWPNGVVPTLSITNTYDVISYFVPANGTILATYVNDFS